MHINLQTQALTVAAVFDMISLQHPVLAKASAGLFIWSTI